MTFDGAPLLPAGVFAQDSGALVVGKEAERGALRAPGRFEPSPKRRIDEGRVLLGDREYDVSWLIGAVLGKAYAEACVLTRTRIPTVVLPYPVGWGQRRRAVLAASAAAARVPAPCLVPEPIAAACYFVSTQRVVVPSGRHVLVYDLGGGTFEATVLRMGARGFEVVATGGMADVGGNDIDAAIVAYLREQVRPDDGAWKQLTQPGSSLELQASRALWDGVREAKERLSRAASTVVSVPLLRVDAPLGREQFEDMARPVLERTITVTLGVLSDARIRPSDLAAVFPVDGSSRIPLVATLLHRALGVAPISIEEPHLAVALGSLVAAPAQGSGPSRSGAAPATPPHGMPAQGAAPPHGTAPPQGSPAQGRPAQGRPGQSRPGQGAAPRGVPQRGVPPQQGAPTRPGIPPYGVPPGVPPYPPPASPPPYWGIARPVPPPYVPPPGSG
ncbi:MAG: Hsp70 family protein [Micromonosporaceae bacterium]|nr:Hsp70 family protein [Micromonosporaceae bacterium]